MQIISPDKVFRGKNAWKKSLPEIVKITKSPLLLGRSPITRSLRSIISYDLSQFKLKVYDSELAGCQPLLTDDECLDCCDGVTIDQFLINSPGTWEVQITPVATGSCESLEYEKTATFEVPEPEGWKPAPVEATLQTMSDQIELATGVKVPPAVVGIGCAFIGGLLLFRVYQKRKSKDGE